MAEIKTKEDELLQIGDNEKDVTKILYARFRKVEFALHGIETKIDTKITEQNQIIQQLVGAVTDIKSIFFDFKEKIFKILIPMVYRIIRLLIVGLLAIKGSQEIALPLLEKFLR